MPRPPKPRFEIVGVDEAVLRTLLPLDELTAIDGVQRLTRIVDGRREECLRLPDPLPEPKPEEAAALVLKCVVCGAELQPPATKMCSARCRRSVALQRLRDGRSSD